MNDLNTYQKMHKSLIVILVKDKIEINHEKVNFGRKFPSSIFGKCDARENGH